MEQTKKLKTSSEFSLSDESSASSSSSIRPAKMVEVKKESVFFRNIQKADREKIHPNRPKSNKASILIVTIQTLKDLMTQVDRPKAEYVTLSQESRERATSNRLSQSNQQPMMNGSDWHHQRG
ncbi:hypothetical protein N665_0253s0009 [Sinapis alba]|nr:hypothetical protein N665_0253s0009 [Sinapis alba]